MHYTGETSEAVDCCAAVKSYVTLGPALAAKPRNLFYVFTKNLNEHVGDAVHCNMARE